MLKVCALQRHSAVITTVSDSKFMVDQVFEEELGLTQRAGCGRFIITICGAAAIYSSELVLLRQGNKCSFLESYGTKSQELCQLRS